MKLQCKSPIYKRGCFGLKVPCRVNPSITLGILKGAMCVQVLPRRVSYAQNDKTLSRDSLRYLSEASLPVQLT